MKCDYETTDAQLQTCIASVIREAEQLQNLDQQISSLNICGTCVQTSFC